MEAKTANVLQRSQDETMLIGLILDGQTNLCASTAGLDDVEPLLLGPLCGGGEYLHLVAGMQLLAQQKVLFVETDQTWLDSVPDNEADMLLNDTRPDRLVFLDQAVSQLRPDDQMLLSFYYYDDKPIREISYITGRTEGYLRSRLQWIRKRMALTIKTLEADEKE